MTNAQTIPLPKVPGNYWLIPEVLSAYIPDNAGGETVQICIPYSKGTGATLSHPNAQTVPAKLWFRYGQHDWREIPGVEHTFVVPRDQVLLLCAHDYDYPKAMIGGVEVTFSTSGGTQATQYRPYKGYWWNMFLGRINTPADPPLEVFNAVAAASVAWPVQESDEGSDEMDSRDEGWYVDATSPNGEDDTFGGYPDEGEAAEAIERLKGKGYTELSTPYRK